MAFSITATELIVDAGTTEVGLTGILNSAGNDIASFFSAACELGFNGKTRIYRFKPGFGLRVAGTLTLNPEDTRCSFNQNTFLDVISGGFLTLGAKEEVTIEGKSFTRLAKGTVISSSRSQRYWWGGNNNEGSTGGFGSLCSVIVRSGAKIHFISGQSKFPGGYGFQTGSSVLCDRESGEDFTHITQELRFGIDIDPITGSTVGQGSGINTGSSNGNLLTSLSDGYFSWQGTKDIKLTGFNFVGGGQFGLQFAPTGNNGIDSTTTNEISLSASQASNGGLTSQATGTDTTFSFTNTRIGNTGNGKDLAIQSDRNTETGFTATKCLVKNEASGTSIRFICDRNNSDGRNWGYYQVSRDLNFNITSGADGSTITGGRYYFIDTNNNLRKNLNSRNNLADKIYSGTLTSSIISSDENVILGIVNASDGDKLGNNSTNPNGYNISNNIARAGNTTITYTAENSAYPVKIDDELIITVTSSGGVETVTNVTATTDGQTTFSVNNISSDTLTGLIKKEQNKVFLMDLRGKRDIPGTDEFDVAYWHPSYNPAIFNDQSLTDNTIGTKILNSTPLEDSNYSDTTTGKEKLDTLDELYDYIKQTKSADDTGILYPTLQTLAVSRTGDLLNIGSRSIQILTDTLTSPYTLSDSSIFVKTTTEFGSGNKFKGVQSTGNIDLDNFNISNMSFKTSSLLENLPTTVDADSLEGTFADTAASGDQTFTFDTNADVSKLKMTFQTTGVITLVNVVSSDFDTNPTAVNGSIVYDPNNATQFIIPSSLPTGWAILKNTTSDTIVFEGEHTKGTQTLLGKFNNDDTHNNDYLIIYKGQNILTGDISDRMAYLTVFTTGSNDSSSNNSVFPGSESIHSDLLTNAAEAVTPGSEKAEILLPAHTDKTADIRISNAQGSLGTTASQTLRMFLLATDTTGSGTITRVVNVGALFSGDLDSDSNSVTMASALPSLIDGYDRAIIEGVTLLKSTFTLSGFGKNNETGTLTLKTGTFADLGITGGFPTYGRFQKTETVTQTAHNLYLRLLANLNAEKDLIVPSPNSGTEINKDVFTLESGSSNKQQYITAAIGDGEDTSDFIGTLTSGVQAVIIYPNPSGLTFDQAQVAADAAIRNSEEIIGISDASIYTAGEQNDLGVRDGFDQTKTYTKSDITN